MTFKTLIVLLSFLSCFICLEAQNVKERKDTLLYNLTEIEVSGNSIKSPVLTQSKGRILWDLEKINNLPQILGQADPIRYTQTLPGIQTNNEYDSGLHIYGCDNTHNYIGIEDVPLYNVNHLLGLFSVFNASHFPTFNINKSAVSAEFPNRLGGQIIMNLPKNIPDDISGDLSIGMISSQGTIKVPFNKKSMICLSTRLCYVNLLYSRALKIDDSQFKYSFGDLNATILHKPDDNNTLLFSFFGSQDIAEMTEDNYMANMGLKWRNIMLSSKWEHKFRNNSLMKHTIYYTAYKNRFNLAQEAIDFKLPSSISDIAYQGVFKKKNLNLGVNASYHNIIPQTPYIEGSYNSTNKQQEQDLHSQEYSLFFDWLFPAPNDIAINTGLRNSLYIDCNNKTYFALNPSLSLSMNKHKWNLSATISMRHQYIYQTGFSSMGFPTEFWLSCDNRHKPQTCINFITTFRYKIAPDLQLSTEIYYKHLKNIIEYNGNILDFIQTDYDINNHLYQGKGRNYGINLMLSASFGKFSGWLSYNLGRALRTFDDKGLRGEFPANHERISELNVVGNLEINDHWSLGATFVLASGTPFTAPEHFYIFSGNLISQYGDHNAYRLRNYSRFDISANYKIKTAHLKESGFNLSIYNAFAHSNELFWQWKIIDGKEFEYRPISFLLKIMPSISYYIKF